MKIAVTGGAGLIGSHLARAYADAGHDVFLIDNLSYGPQQRIESRARFYRLDIRDEQLSSILKHEGPDIVSHHVEQPNANVPVERSLSDADLHIRGLLNVLNACVQANVKKFILASNGNSLYGIVKQLPITEEQLLSPQSSADICKACGEWYTRYYTSMYGLKHTILRYADIYAEHDAIHTFYQHHPLNYFIDQLAQGKAPIIRGTGKEMRDHIFIDDVVSANLHALTSGENRTFHISSGRSYSLNQLYQAAAQAMNSKLTPVYISGRLDGESTTALDNTRARHLLQWRPEITLEEGVRRAVQRIHNQQANRLVETFDETESFIQTEPSVVVAHSAVVTS